MPTTFDDDEFGIRNSPGYFLAVRQWDEIIFVSVNEQGWNAKILPLESVHCIDLFDVILNACPSFGDGIVLKEDAHHGTGICIADHQWQSYMDSKPCHNPCDPIRQ